MAIDWSPTGEHAVSTAMKDNYVFVLVGFQIAPSFIMLRWKQFHYWSVQLLSCCLLTVCVYQCVYAYMFCHSYSLKIFQSNIYPTSSIAQPIACFFLLDALKCRNRMTYLCYPIRSLERKLQRPLLAKSRTLPSIPQSPTVSRVHHSDLIGGSPPRRKNPPAATSHLKACTLPPAGKAEFFFVVIVALGMCVPQNSRVWLCRIDCNCVIL